MKPEKAKAKIGEGGLGSLKRLGFKRLSECLLVVPKEYRDYRQELNVVDEGMVGNFGYFGLAIDAVAMFDKFKQPTRTFKEVIRVQIDTHDARGRNVRMSVFGAVWPWLKKTRGETVYVYGKVAMWNGFLMLENPMQVEEHEHGKIVPIYRGKVGQVSGETVREGVTQAMGLVDDTVCNLLAELGMLEDEFKQITGIKSVAAFIKAIHQPIDINQGSKAVSIAKKLAALAIVRRAEANMIRKPMAKASITVNRAVVEGLVGRLPYPLTSDQWKAIQEIVNDLRAPYAMNRLLSGDVGTGKSLTFFIPAVAAYLAGATVGIIVPSQLLVGQIARELRGFFPEIEVYEVTSGGKIGEGIGVGTTAIISAAKKKKHIFDFLIVDEQHKFSVGQKQELLKSHTNFLESTATVIPRTLAIVNYGGMDLSVLRECPVNKKIDTRIVEAGDEERMFGFVERVFDKDSQVAVILPLVEEQSEDVVEGRLESVESAYAKWSAKFPHRRVGVLTGRMEGDEKNRVIQQMNDKEIDLLISTVVIETGVTLPSLKALIVVHPERFGVSALHQLRGRVARKGGNGYFMMFSPVEIEEEAAERLDILVQHKGGFEIAEADMELRGFGDVENESDAQTGDARLLFWGLRVDRSEIESAAKRSKVLAKELTLA